jgi:hypothetical protein
LKKFTVLLIVLTLAAFGNVFAANDLTFQVDMSIQVLKGNFEPGTSTISVAGSFQGWAGDVDFLSDADGDTIYTLTVADIAGNAGDVIEFKYIMNGGWEGVDNRQFTLTGNPETLDVVFFNNEDVLLSTVNLTFRVNMTVQQAESNFDPAVDVVRTAGSHQGWNPGAAPDMDDSDGDMIYEETAVVDAQTTYYYKHIIGTDWGNNEGDPNREAVVGDVDVVLPVVWFDNDSVVTNIADGFIEFAVNMSVMTEVGIFDNVNDSLQVRGSFNGWGPGEPTRAMLNQDPLDPDGFFLNVDFTQVGVGDVQYYKFFVNKATTDLGWDDGYERPLTHGGGNRSIEFLGQSNQSAGLVYYDDVAPDQTIPSGTNLQVTFRVDMTNAADANMQAVPFEAGVDTVWWICEQPSFVMTQGWEDTNEMTVRELTDPDGDMVYEGTMTVSEPGFNAFEYRYGFYDVSEAAWTSEPEGFSNFAYRVRYAGQDAANSFPVNPWTMPVDTWTNSEIKPDQEDDPYTSYNNWLSIDGDVATPMTYALSQNYPNPFNPTTTISYEIPANEKVSLVVYDILGQKVKTLVNGVVKAGTHEVVWNGANEAGSRLSSGVYFYQLDAGSFSRTMKMIMLK